jgi:type VI secretion system secreted protein Hcp
MPSNMFLKFEKPEIDGSCQVEGHVNEIEVLGWSHGFVQQSIPELGKDAQEYATHTNLSFTKYLDIATNELLKLCWQGKQIGMAKLSCYRLAAAGGKPEEYLEVKMEHVLITSISVSGAPSEMPMENITLDYGIVTYEYKHPRYADGSYRPATAKHDRERRRIE